MPNLSLRDVPDEYQQIKEIAERERRSINQQILVLLERSVQQQKQPKAEVLGRIRQRQTMKGEVQFRADRLAVLIDADNARASLIEPLLKEITKYGTASVKRIYGDWTSPQLGSWKSKLHQFAIRPIQQFSYTSGKNSTDSALIIDAMDLLYTQTFDGFCIVSSDCDFTRLADRIRESGLLVYGFGEKKTPEPFVKACDKFIYTEILDGMESGVFSSSVESTSTKSSPSSHHPASITNSELNKKVKHNQELVNLLKDAYEASAEEDGWVNFGAFGSQINKISPSFDSRNYGYKKLGELVRAIDLFNVKETPHEKNPALKELYIKMNSPA